MKKITIIMILGFLSNYTQAQNADWIEAKYKGKPIVEIILNGNKTWVLLDTGSDFTILDTKQQNKFKFITLRSSDASLRVPGFGSTGNVLSPVSYAKLDFGGVRLRGPVFAFDLSTISESIHRRTGRRIAGIIGTRMMSVHGFVIDMRNGTASIPVKNKKRKSSTNIDDEPLVITTHFNRSN